MNKMLITLAIIITLILFLIFYFGIEYKIFKLKSEVKNIKSSVESILNYELNENLFVQKNFNFVNKYTKNKILSIRILKTVYKFAKLYDLDPDLILCLIAIESNFKPNAISRKNAVGLTQILPETGEIISKMLGRFFYDLYDIEDNIEFCCAYLYHLKKFSNNDEKIMLQKYYAGRYFEQKEAIKYAQKIIKLYRELK